MTQMTPYSAYRDTDITWLGKIPAHWEVKRLKNITSINYENLSETTDADYIIQYIDISNVDEVEGVGTVLELSFENAPSRARRIVRSGDTIISTVRTYLKAVLYFENPPENQIVSTGFAVLRPIDGVFPKFLFWLIQSKEFIEKVVVHSVGVGYPAINPSELSRLLAWLPPLYEQRLIAAFLDRQTAKIDALIAKKQRLFELLAEKRAALISRAVTKGLNPAVEMKDSDVEWLGQVPEHWEILPLKHAVENRPGAIKTGPFGSQLLSSEMLEGEIKVYNQRSVIDRDFVSGENYISQEKYKDLFSFTTYPGDVLLTTRGTIGRCAILPQNAEPGILHPCLMRIQPHRRKLLAEYLALLIQDSFLLQTQLFLLSNATTIDVIYSDTMKRMIIPLPSLSEQREIIDYIKEEAGKIDTLIEKVKTAIERLHEYRSALISSAVTGKMDVREPSTSPGG